MWAKASETPDWRRKAERDRKAREAMRAIEKARDTMRDNLNRERERCDG